MNPWSFYEHKPQLVQACVAAGVAWVALRREPVVRLLEKHFVCPSS